MRAVKFHVSPELLAQALHMPSDTAFAAVAVELQWGRPVITMVVTSESAAFPEVPEGCEPPVVTPSVTAIHQQRQDKRADEWLWDWSINS